ncbi:MAG TPA: PAS domain S-box protein, partial [Acidimicrobiia bacterium]
MATSERPVILVVDGDEATRLLFTRTLTGAGFDVAAAADGAGAVAILDDRPIRTVVLDKQLAEVTGPPIIERLRAEANARSLPLILVTDAPTDIIDEVAGFGAGATDFLVKPVDLDELVVRVKAEVRVNDVLERARRIAETTTDAFVSFDEEDLILAWAGQAEQVFGWSEPEAIGRRFGDMLLAPHHRPGHALRVRRFLDLGEQPLLGEWVELVGLHRDGREFPIEITEWGLYTNGRHSIHAFIRDVSRQRQTQRVQQQANPSGSHFAAIADLIMLSEPAGRIVYVSPSVEAALGWDVERLVGTPRMDLLHPDDRGSAEQEATELDAGSDVTGACRFRRSDGTYTWMQFSRGPIFDRATREVIGVRTVAREITKWLADEAER